MFRGWVAFPGSVVPGVFVPSGVGSGIEPGRVLPRCVARRFCTGCEVGVVGVIDGDGGQSAWSGALCRVDGGWWDEVDVTRTDQNFPPLTVDVVVASGAQHHPVGSNSLTCPHGEPNRSRDLRTYLS